MTSTHRDPKSELATLLRSLASLIHVPTSEEDRALAVIREAAKEHEGQAVVVWTATAGFGSRGGVGESVREPERALEHVLKEGMSKPTIYVLKDFHHYVGEPLVLRLLRDIASEFRRVPSSIVLISPALELPRDLEKDIAIVDFPLPTREELRLLFLGYLEDAARSPRLAGLPQVDEALADRVVSSLAGLTEIEAEDAIARGFIVAAESGDPESLVRSVQASKESIIRKSRCLEAFDADVGLGDVGGLDVLKAWVMRRERVLSEAARTYGIEPPKGIVTLGVPGGGKGLSARAVAHAWKLPLLRLDMGAVFDGFVGGSEANLREALKIAEAVAPVVLWVDEVEKGLAGTGSSNASDGGTTARVFGAFLTWLQERKAPVFCYFTANDVSGLPPELLRKGRVDELFFIDLPNAGERDQILRIHLRKRGRDPENFDLEALVDASEGFVGAEIEQVIKEALVNAFSEDREVVSRDVIEAFQTTRCLAVTQRDRIADLRRFVEEGRAVRASSGAPVSAPAPDAGTPPPFWAPRPFIAGGCPA